MSDLILIVRADDAGSCIAANEAIYETAARGIVRNISVMAAGPCLDDAAWHFRDLAGVVFGLHATINAEWDSPRWRPVSPPDLVPSLLDKDSCFTRSPQVLHERGFSTEEVGREIRAQLAAMRTAGFEPSYLDTHMGFDWLDGVKAVLERIANDEGLALDSAASHPRLPSGDSLRARLRAAARGRWVLITHPGRSGGDMDFFTRVGNPPGSIAAARARETAELLDPALAAMVERGELVLEQYKLPASTAQP